MVATAVVGTVSPAKREAARADRTGLYTRTVDTLATAVTPTARWHGVGLTWSALVRLHAPKLVALSTHQIRNYCNNFCPPVSRYYPFSYDRILGFITLDRLALKIK